MDGKILVDERKDNALPPKMSKQTAAIAHQFDVISYDLAKLASRFHIRIDVDVKRP